MKVSINLKNIDGAYGGGKQFVDQLRKYLEDKGHRVVNTLLDNNIDIILLVSPLLIQSSGSYSYTKALLYKFKHPNTIIVQRLNICDDGRGSNNLDNGFKQSVKAADYLVYISNWLFNILDKKINPKQKPSSVILNGADGNIFKAHEKKKFLTGEKMKIVTHHWSNNYLKGHDIYQKFDKLLDESYFKDRFIFTYIGNYPEDIEYKNVVMKSVKNSNDLAIELKNHNVYLTAAQNEAAGMHHIEGALSGLPLLYRRSGALPEYCNNFGIEFSFENFDKKLIEMFENYEYWSNKIINYKNSSDKTSEEYYKLFNNLIKNNSMKKNTSFFDRVFLIIHVIQSVFYNIFSLLKLYFKFFLRYI